MHVSTFESLLISLAFISLTVDLGFSVDNIGPTCPTETEKSRYKLITTTLTCSSHGGCVMRWLMRCIMVQFCFGAIFTKRLSVFFLTHLISSTGSWSKPDDMVVVPSCINHLITQPPWLLLLSSLGFLSLLTHALSLLKWVYAKFLRPSKNLKHYGSWALITGASDGIGKAFAHQLALQGLNLILVGRNPQKLESVSSGILAQSPSTEIKIVTFDFCGDIPNGVRLIEEAIEGLDVGVLINNVGITYPAARFFHEVEERIWMDIIRVNVEGTTRVTKAVIPGMIKRRSGAVVNVGSGAAIVVPSHPLYTIYAATKAFVDQLSRSLHVEYKGCGIHVQCQVPLYVATNMASKAAAIEKSTLFIPSTYEYVRAAICHIGYEPRCTPYWAHSIQWCLARLLVPDDVLDAWRLYIGIIRRGKPKF